MRFAFILAERACWPVAVMCAVMKVSTGCAARPRPPWWTSTGAASRRAVLRTRR